ncbi:ABT1 [Mytilus edulis]|uniref:ESF2 n=1 Tax=Mytilus edulis TaxID=6550 RepID=A0A8S3UVV2_MYTED|nr:ABT1 [Mytilus edulis]
MTTSKLICVNDDQATRRASSFVIDLFLISRKLFNDVKNCVTLTHEKENSRGVLYNPKDNNMESEILDTRFSIQNMTNVDSENDNETPNDDTNENITDVDSESETETPSDDTKKRDKKKRKNEDPGIKHVFCLWRRWKIFLQPDDKAANTKKGRMFTEGWVEFEDKKVAKSVATKLNSKQIGGKKKSRWYDEMWTLKYLHRFKWGHLNERLAYERAVHKQRMRTEIAQVKREANFYIQNAEKSRTIKHIKERKLKRGETFDEPSSDRSIEVSQRSTEEEIMNKRKRKLSARISDKTMKKPKGTETELVNKKSLAAQKSFINKLFSKSSAASDED